MPIRGRLFLSGGEMQEVQQPGGYTPASEKQYVTAEELQNTKDQINLSFEEVANMISDLARAYEMLEERIALYNVRSSHKI
jgi:hypothetical protein